ncbi:MAG: D-alanyl-D-alanine carboxypeptidase [Pelagibacteraceae bacterium]|mgnify:CR=1 FL=1|nr:D-alanyl-D-alanine carboxypeptidase [Pelagibacteraceae bacterium]
MPKFIVKYLFLSLIIITSKLNALESIAPQALLIDLTSGQVFIDKNSNLKTFPSSMTKMMTVLVAFEKIKKGELSLDQKFLVSKKAWKMGGSKMFVEVDKKVSVEDLLRGIIVQSGNDASIVLAEGISGSEEAFSSEMNLMGKMIGLKGSNFVNSSGMPAKDHYSTVRDLAIIAEYTIKNFPEFYEIYAEKEFSFSGINQPNRNPLLGNSEGNDGLKTGYTSDAGYGYVGSSERNGRRLILAFNGLDSSKQRKQEATRLMEWGFSNFKSINFYKKNEVVFSADTWLGEDKKINLIAPKDIFLSVPKANLIDMKVNVEINDPIQTPIQKGEVIGKLIIKYSKVESSFDLISEKTVKQKNFFSSIFSAAYYLAFGSN